MSNRPKPNSLAKLSGQIWWAGVNSVEARRCTENFVSVDQGGICFGTFKVRHDQYRNILVIGGGKGIGEMGAGLESALLDGVPADKKIYGRLNVPDDKVISLKAIEVVGCRPPGQNLPTERVVASTRQIIESIQNSHPDDLIIFLIAGGGSALLELPIPPLKLDELQGVTRLLSQRGASIHQLNAVRKRLSRVKGGGLARIAGGRMIVTLTISDVLGDPLNIIASGPTVLDPETNSNSVKQEAVQVLKEFAFSRDEVPASVWSILERPDSEEQEENRSDDLISKLNLHFIIANNQSAVEAAGREAETLGFAVNSETDFESSSIEDVAARVVRVLETGAADVSGSRGCFISGGEPVVRLGSNPGLGGRNQHLVLTVLEKLVSNKFVHEKFRFSFLSGGTDGEDGTTNVAGGLIDESILERVIQGQGLEEIRSELRAGNSFGWLSNWDAIFESGKTGTNVCDLRVVVWERD